MTGTGREPRGTAAMAERYAARAAEVMAHPEALVSLGARLGQIAAAKAEATAVTTGPAKLSRTSSG